MLVNIFTRYNKIFEFYHPFDSTIDGLTRKGNLCGPVPYMNGSQNPLAALILNMESAVRKGRR